MCMFCTFLRIFSKPLLAHPPLHCTNFFNFIETPQSFTKSCKYPKIVLWLYCIFLQAKMKYWMLF